MKRKLAIMLTLVLAVLMSVTGCGTSSTTSSTGTPAAKKYVFGVINVGAQYPYYKATVSGMQEQATKEGNVTLKVLDSQVDVGKEMSNLENLITQKVDLILLINVGETDGDQCVAKATAAKIPIIAVSRECSPNAKPLCSIVTDASTAQGFADDMAKQLGGKGKICEIQGVLGVSNVTLRHQALLNVLKANPGMTLLDSKAGDFDPVKAQSVAADMISVHPDLEAFYVHDDGSAQGVIQAVKAAGKEGKIKIFSTGGDPSGIASIKAGTQQSTWAILTGWEGAMGVHEGVKYLKGDTVPEHLTTPSTGVYKSNIGDHANDYWWYNINWPDFPIN
jgi:ribose transport system substrate-binding protein